MTPRRIRTTTTTEVLGTGASMAAFVSLGLLQQLCNNNKAHQSRNAKGVQHQARAGTKKVRETFVGGAREWKLTFRKTKFQII
jgi:hypothetical protein